MKVYLAGPMRGVKWFNFPAFDAVAQAGRAAGWTVISPADMDRAAGLDALTLPDDTDWSRPPEWFDFAACMDRCISAVKWCDEVGLLAGWEKSRGAVAEAALALWLGKDVWEVDRMPEDGRVARLCAEAVVLEMPA